MPRRKSSAAPPTDTPLAQARSVASNPEISFIEPPAADEAQIPEQKQHFQLPTRFGAVPVDEAPLGWEVETRPREVKVTKFQHAYPTIRLPFQEVQRVEFGHSEHFLAENEQHPKLRALFPAGANRLFFGDNLHVMRQLPSESIDLIYIDPPFFSGRNYNVIFGDKNEVRSFVKVEMDKIFGYDSLVNEVVWSYQGTGSPKKGYKRKHDIILFYARSEAFFFDQTAASEPMTEKTKGKFTMVDEQGRQFKHYKHPDGTYHRQYLDET